MKSQVLIGGQKIEESEQFKNKLLEHQNILTKEFDQKLQDLERERLKLIEGKCEITNYKDLLIKQRDIMIALSSRLNERDEMNNQLQEELDEYELVNR